MPVTRPARLWASLALLVAVSGCGSGWSSGTPVAEPSDATLGAFCQTFGRLGPGTTARQAAAAFTRIGTPPGIAPGVRHGYEVLVAQMRTMPDNGTAAEFEAQLKSLSRADHRDVNAFFGYVRGQCNGPTS